MSHVQVTVEGDSARFIIEEGKPSGVPNTHREFVVANDNIGKLRPLPPMRDSHYDSAELIWLPNVEEWVVIVYKSYQERSMGPNEEDIHGPLLPPIKFDRPSARVPAGDDTQILRLSYAPYLPDSGKINKKICPRCGQESQCGGSDITDFDANDHWDCYALWCSCGYAEFTCVFGGYIHGNNWDTVCPYCDGASRTSVPSEIMARYEDKSDKCPVHVIQKTPAS